MTTLLAPDPFSHVLGAARGEYHPRSAWQCMDSKQQEKALFWSRLYLEEQAFAGNEEEGYEAFNAIWKPAYDHLRPLHPKQKRWTSFDIEDELDKAFIDAFSLAVTSTNDYFQALAQAAHIRCQQQYHDFAGCGCPKTVSEDGPWVMENEDGSTLCLRCAIYKDQQDMLQDTAWSGIYSTEGRYILSSVGSGDGNIDTTDVDRVLLTLTSGSRAGATGRISWKGVDANGNPWYGSVHHPGCITNMKRNKAKAKKR